LAEPRLKEQLSLKIDPTSYITNRDKDIKIDLSLNQILEKTKEFRFAKHHKHHKKHHKQDEEDNEKKSDDESEVKDEEE